MRGEGLLIGVKAVVPSGDLVDALRDEKLLTVGAGDNVVRFLPPLIVTEAEIAEAVEQLERACVALSRQREAEEGGGVMSKCAAPFPRSHELPPRELRGMLDASRAMKAKLQGAARTRDKPLDGKTLAMIFDKPSTRTRVSFDVGMRQLGGESIMLTGAEMQLGRGETIADTARVLSRYVDAIMIRILNHDALLELAAHATVPVINGLTRRSHPCQVMADLMTFEEHRGPIEGQHRGLDRRRQQRAGLVGACGGALRVPAQRRDPAGTRAEQGDEGLDQGDRRADRARHRSGGGRARRRLRRHRHLGLDGRQGRRAPPQPAEALSGQCAS